MFAALQERMAGLLDKLSAVSADGVCHVAGAAIADIIDNTPPPLYLEDE